MSFEIESGIQAPSMGNGRRTKYPWRDLDVGQSFFVPQTAVKNIHSSVMQANKRYAPSKYMSAKAEKNGVVGLRIWRVE